MKIAKLAIAAALVMMVAAAYAYVPEDEPENSYQERVEGPFLEATDLVNDGIKAIRQNVVSSTYENVRGSKLGEGGLAEAEAGKEEVTSKDILYYEPKEEIYEAKETMDEVLIWLTMYRTTKPDDVVTYKKMKEYVTQKQKMIEKLINALKFEKDNKDAVMDYKLKIKKADKDYKRYVKRLKGKLQLIEGKPLPEPKNAD
jgi:hypothetical protein